MGGIVDYLKENPNYFDDVRNYLRKGIVWNYDASMSTSKREVYKYCFSNNGSVQTSFLAVSPDKSSIIYWVESNGTMGEKQYFIRIEKEALLPKNINRDFLYE